jgi:hypothetical protein
MARLDFSTSLGDKRSPPSAGAGVPPAKNAAKRAALPGKAKGSEELPWDLIKKILILHLQGACWDVGHHN